MCVAGVRARGEDGKSPSTHPPRRAALEAGNEEAWATLEAKLPTEDPVAVSAVAAAAVPASATESARRMCSRRDARTRNTTSPR